MIESHESNFELISFNQQLFNDAIEEMQNEGIEIEKIKDIADWVNSKPYPYTGLKKRMNNG